VIKLQHSDSTIVATSVCLSVCLCTVTALLVRASNRQRIKALSKQNQAFTRKIPPLTNQEFTVSDFWLFGEGEDGISDLFWPFLVANYFFYFKEFRVENRERVRYMF
jgi:hypothetical protein